MGRRKVRHSDPLTTLHITDSAFQFIDSQRRRSEPRYQTLDRIFTKYHELVDKSEWLKEAEAIAREERNKAEQQVLELKRQLKCTQ